MPIDDFAGNDIRTVLSPGNRTVTVYHFDDVTHGWGTILVYDPSTGWVASSSKAYFFKPGEAFAVVVVGAPIEISLAGLVASANYPSTFEAGKPYLLGVTTQLQGPINVLIPSAGNGDRVNYAASPSSTSFDRTAVKQSGVWTPAAPTFAAGQAFYYTKAKPSPTPAPTPVK